MAYKYFRSQQDKFSVTGILDEEAKTISFENRDFGTVCLNIQDYLDQFASQEITLTITSKTEDELYLSNESGEE